MLRKSLLIYTYILFLEKMPTRVRNFGLKLKCKLRVDIGKQWFVD